MGRIVTEYCPDSIAIQVPGSLKMKFCISRLKTQKSGGWPIHRGFFAMSGARGVRGGVWVGWKQVRRAGSKFLRDEPERQIQGSLDFARDGGGMEAKGEGRGLKSAPWGCLGALRRG